MILDPTTDPTVTFWDLVGGPMTLSRLPDPMSSAAQPAQAERVRSSDRLMRIYLPDGVMREMTLVQYQEFLVPYRFSDTAEPSAGADNSLRGAAQEGSGGLCVAAAGS